MDKVGIIGAGSWGTALSLVLANNGHSVEIWSIVKEEIDMLKEKHEHVDKLPGVKLPDRVTFTTDLGSVIKNNDILVLAVPSVYTRSTAKSMAPYVKDKQIIVCVAKGTLSISSLNSAIASSAVFSKSASYSVVASFFATNLPSWYLLIIATVRFNKLPKSLAKSKLILPIKSSGVNTPSFPKGTALIK